MKTLSKYERNVLRRFSVGDLLVRTADRYPNKLAFSFKDEKFTYKEFNEIVNRCAHGLLKLGIKKGDRAAIMSHNCHQFVFLWWALLKIGAIVTPLNFMLQGKEVKYVIDHSEAKVFFVEDSFVKNVLPVIDELKSVEIFGFINLSGEQAPEGLMNIEDLWINEYSVNEPEVIVGFDDPASLLYTSGTEANPKGVLYSHLNYFAAVFGGAVDCGWSTSDRTIAGIPLYHIACMFLFCTFVTVGGYTVLEYAPNPVEILEITQNEKITQWPWPPTLYAGLLNLPGLDNYDLSSLKSCFMFGALAAPAVIEKWKQIVPQAGFFNYYGSTETTLGTLLTPTDFDKKPSSIGKSHTPLKIKVVDENDIEVPPGEVGELVSRGPTVMIGYYRDEERTNQTFRGGWHHSGDFVKCDQDGYVYFVDRKKDVIKSGGENVSSQEVEAVLFKHPSVANVAVVGLPDPYWSEIVAAVVVPVPGKQISEEELIAFCKKELAGYKVPKKIFKTDSLPVNPSGKIQKNVLRQQLAKAEK